MSQAMWSQATCWLSWGLLGQVLPLVLPDRSGDTVITRRPTDAQRMVSLVKLSLHTRFYSLATPLQSLPAALATGRVPCAFNPAILGNTQLSGLPAPHTVAEAFRSAVNQQKGLLQAKRRFWTRLLAAHRAISPSEAAFE